MTTATETAVSPKTFSQLQEVMLMIVQDELVSDDQRQNAGKTLAAVRKETEISGLTERHAISAVLRKVFNPPQVCTCPTCIIRRKEAGESITKA